MTWWRRVFSRDRLESQLDAELRDHFDRLVARFHRARATREREARRLARLEFGGMDQVKEAVPRRARHAVGRRNAAGRALRPARFPQESGIHDRRRRHAGDRRRRQPGDLQRLRRAPAAAAAGASRVGAHHDDALDGRQLRRAFLISAGSSAGRSNRLVCRPLRYRERHGVCRSSRGARARWCGVGEWPVFRHIAIDASHGSIADCGRRYTRGQSRRRALA